MLRHWLVRNGQKVTGKIVYITTRDESSLSQLDQVLDGVRKLEWNIEDVYVIEKATSKSHKKLSQLILERI